MIRSFIAIDLPEEFHDEINRVTNELRPAGGHVKWVRPENVHLTLKFLGDVPEDKIEPIGEAVAGASAGRGLVNLVSSGIGVFPNRSKPRVIWLGLTGDLDRLTGLQQDVENSVTPFGFFPEKRAFKPHLTLGRVKSPKGKGGLMNALEKVRPKEIMFSASELVLFKSDLRPGGAVYTPLKRMPLL